MTARRTITRRPRSAFTLFELLLAVALSAVLLVLVGGAINLYLLECESDRLEVEEAQLARVTLDLIASDLRASFYHQPQDVSQLSQSISTAAAAASEEDGGGGGFGGGGGSGSGSGGGSGGASGSTSTADEEELPPAGIYGNTAELLIDILRLPKVRDWMVAEESAAEVATTIDQPSPPSDVRSVRWFVREGELAPPSSVLVTSLEPEQQARIGGLVRQEFDRASRIRVDGGDGSFLAELAGELVAPEVIAIQFRYFTGEEPLESWDTYEASGLPAAVEVRIWIRPLSATDVNSEPVSLDQARQYAMTVAIPLADGPALGQGDTGSTSSSSSSSTSNGGS